MFAAIGSPLQLLVDVPPLDDLHWAGLVLKKPGHSIQEEGVGLILQALDLHAVLQHAPELRPLPQLGDSLLQLDGL